MRINEFGEKIVEFIEPDIKLDLFYYSFSNKFKKLLFLQMEKIVLDINLLQVNLLKFLD